MKNMIISGTIGIMATFLRFWMWENALQQILAGVIFPWSIYELLED